MAGLDFRMDFAPIGDLAKIYQQAQQQRQTQDWLQQQGLPGNLNLAQIALANQRDVRDYGLRERQFKLAEQQATRREEPEQLRVLKAAGVDPNTPQGREYLFPKAHQPLSPTDKKAIDKAEDDVPSLEATIKNVGDAMKLNDKVYTGYGASLRGQLGAKAPDWLVPDFVASPETGASTVEWDQLMGAEAIKNMSETLKGASTDFEMRKFLSIAADTANPPKVRENAMKRFQDLANAELELRRKRAADIRSGTHYKPPGAARPAGGDPLSEARAAISKGAPRDAVIKRLRDNGIDPSGL